MLILTRRPQESIVIDDGNITIKVLGIVGNQVRFGINAPRDVVIDREEVFERKKREQDSLDGNQSPAGTEAVDPEGKPQSVYLRRRRHHPR